MFILKFRSYPIKYGDLYRNLKSFSGFTLAETLITLVIIGVVVALTIPNLIAKHRNHVLSTQFKYAYNILYNTTNQILY